MIPMTLHKSIYLSLLILISLVFSAAPVNGQADKPDTPTARLAFAAYRHGQWDIYSLAPDGSDPRQLTNDPFEDTDPAYAPDGQKIAFASRRDQNWDVIVLDLTTGQQTQLTTSPDYDGAPTWSPDGQHVAYESYHNGNLDIWQIDAAGNGPAANLTADSAAGDFAPAWRPDGHAIAFTSWRGGSKDLFLLDVADGRVTRLTDSRASEEWPAWSPDGRALAFVTDHLGDREVSQFDLIPQKTTPLTWLGRTDSPIWLNGGALAAVWQRFDGEVIITQTPGDRLPRLLTAPITIQGRLTWHGRVVNAGQPVESLVNGGDSPLYQENVSLNGKPGQEPYNMVRLNDLDVGTPWLADTVDESFRAWRVRLKNEVGYDFLSKLSDAARDVGAYTETSQYASWHKSGRAVDTLFDYHLEGELAHEIVREDYSGETYWRVLLRCVDQSGRCGRPVTVNPWNYSTRARTQIAPEQGGLEKTSPPAGYYVDFTALAREYGWQRISSHDDKDYSWTWHFLAFEYWHYQKTRTDGHRVNWYQAMREVYPTATLNDYFTWQKMQTMGEKPHLIALKGVPLPLEVKPWWAIVDSRP
jgi:TolB protein